MTTDTTHTARPPEATAPAVAAHTIGLTKTYGEGDSAVAALDRVDVAITKGRFTAVMGPSGSGKSTLMHCLAGLETPSAGRVLIGGTDITAMSDHDLTLLRRDRIGFVFQAFNLLPMLTARDNVLLPLTLAGRRVDIERFEHVTTVLRIADRLDHRPSELSGGQQQRVAVARALITSPDVLFADEPTGALDSRTSAQLLDFLRSSVRELGQTVVMVTHDPRAASYADEVLLLADGRVAGSLTGPTEDSVLAAMKGLGE
ncbi:ABC transporter ATP-binding protein [Janibacter indicus]|uniref:ABC transporter ATP-binding protein n=1 Tax=Janibacter indicus TaxID=857417 RepID=UPI000932CA83|nr:ABC transporter ATP-binding protein [Janibacter indicus]